MMMNTDSVQEYKNDGHAWILGAYNSEIWQEISPCNIFDLFNMIILPDNSCLYPNIVGKAPCLSRLPVVPHKAVAEVSKIGNL
jgi:hypothetical protein